MPHWLSVFDLRNVNLATAWPCGVMPNRVAKHPPRRPDALLAVGVVTAEANKSLDSGDFALRRREYIVGFDAARRPTQTIEPRYQLKGVTAA